MGQEALFNRCLWDVTQLSHDECRTLGDNACGASERVEFRGSVSGFQGLKFRPLQLYPSGNFLLYATDWERLHSNLIPFSWGDIDAKPVVGEQAIPELFVKTPFGRTIRGFPIAGHVVTANVKYVYGPSKFGVGGSQAVGTAPARLKSILTGGMEAFVSGIPPKGLAPLGEYNSGMVVTFKVYVDLNGKILALLTAGTGEAGLESEDPISYLLMVPGLIQLGKLGAKMIWSTVARSEVAQGLASRTAASLRQRLLARGASSELAEFATLTEEELSKVRGGMAEMKKPRMTAADLNDFVQQERPGMGPKERLTTAERNGAREIIGALERVRNGDLYAWAELIPGRGPNAMKMLRFGDLAKQGWAEIDLLKNNPGALNKMRMLVRVVRGDVEYKLMQVH